MSEVGLVAGILVVDDDDDLREIMSELLRSYGVERCIVAATLAEVEENAAVALATSLALVDVNLGARQPTGLDVERWLRRNGYRGRVVFLTGHAADDPRVKQALATEGTRVVSKPISSAQLMELARA